MAGVGDKRNADGLGMMGEGDVSMMGENDVAIMGEDDKLDLGETKVYKSGYSLVGVSDGELLDDGWRDVIMGW